MKVNRHLIVAVVLMLAGCIAGGSRMVHDSASSLPGTTVALKGKPQNLVGTPIKVGMPIPDIPLIDAFSMEKVSLARGKGKILLLSLVPSIDTPVCEEQTHYLGEKANLPEMVKLITISRDTPFAQKRFATESGLENVTFLSDHREGAFGRSTGLLVEESMLLARAIIIVDKGGIVTYLQVVPELSHLPDMEAAFAAVRAMIRG